MNWIYIAIWTWIIVIIVIFITYLLHFQKKKNAGSDSKKDYINYADGYKSKWLFSNNEKESYKKIKEVTDILGLTLFAKVRLFDLVEPKPDLRNNKAYQWKIQAKHVDFVVCDKKLVARTVIELDDSSHNRKDRIERDLFVDTVLSNTGYKVIRLSAVDTAALKIQLEEMSNSPPHLPSEKTLERRYT